MRKNITFLIFIMPMMLLAQAPYVFNYQGVATDNEGQPLSNQVISLAISIIEGFEDGNIVFGEEHQVVTNETGVFAVRIGLGDQFTGNLRNVEWGSDKHYIRVEIDPEGGDNYENLGETQLFSVPYALYATKAGNAEGGSNQNLELNGTILSIDNGNSVDLVSIQDGVEDADADPQNELQTLSLNGNNLAISDGNSISIQSLQDGVEDADADPQNELQTLSISGSSLSISDGNSVSIQSLQDGVEDADADPQNELQTLSLNGSDLSISGGNTVDLSGLGSGNGGGSEYWQMEGTDILSTDLRRVRVGPGDDQPYAQIEKTIDDIGVFRAFNKRDDEPGILRSNYVDGEFGHYGFTRDSEITHWLGASGSSGIMSLFEGGNALLEASALNSGGGFLEIFGPSQNENIKLTSLSGFPDNGFISATNSLGENTARMFVASNDFGVVNTDGPNGFNNVRITSLASNNNHGYIGVYDGGGNDRAGVYVDSQGRGIVYGTMKNFRIQHPRDPNKEIVYASLEGPEAAVYLRGTTKLVNGEAYVDFPEHFSLIILDNSMTVQTTPLSAESNGLAVIKKTQSGFAIKELMKGQGNYEVDWEVKAVRAGLEDFEAVRLKSNGRSASKLEDAESSSKRKRNNHPKPKKS